MPEPVTLAELKVTLRLDAAAGPEDGYLGGLIVAARRRCELVMNRSVAGGPRIRVLDTFPACEGLLGTRGSPAVALPGGLVSSVETIRYDAGAGMIPLDAARYVADVAGDPPTVWPVRSWPRTSARPGAVVIAYTLAPMTDDDVAVAKQAILLLAGHWYDGARTDAGGGDDTPLPQAVLWLLGDMRRGGIR